MKPRLKNGDERANAVPDNPASGAQPPPCPLPKDVSSWRRASWQGEIPQISAPGEKRPIPPKRPSVSSAEQLMERSRRAPKAAAAGRAASSDGQRFDPAIAERFASVESSIEALALMRDGFERVDAQNIDIRSTLVELGAKMDRLLSQIDRAPTTQEVALQAGLATTPLPVPMDQGWAGGYQSPSSATSPTRRSKNKYSAAQVGSVIELGDAAAMAGNLVFDSQHTDSKREKYRHVREETCTDMNWVASSGEKKDKKKNVEVETDVIKRIGNSILFRLVSTILVLTNVIIVGFETNMKVSHSIDTELCLEGSGPPPLESNLAFFTVAEWVMIVWMLGELAINVYTAGGMFVEGGEWNVFDAVILIGSLVQMAISKMNLSFLRILRLLRLLKFIRVLRLVKVFKVLHIVKFLHGVRRMILSMVGSLTSLFWATFLIFFFLFIVSIIVMQGIEMHYDGRLEDVADLGQCRPVADNSGWTGQPAFDNKILPMLTVDPERDTHTQQMAKLYGSVPKTMTTFFGTISGGAEWPVVGDPVMQISPVFTFFWIGFVCAMLFGVLNVFVGIFVEAAMEAAQQDTTTMLQQQQEELENATRVLKAAFEKIDSDGSGMLSEEEFEEVLADEEVSAMLSHLGLQAGEAKGLFRLLDDDRSGKLNVDEFIDGCMSLKGGARRIDAITLMSQNKRLAKTVASLMEMTEDLWIDIESWNGAKPGSQGA